MCSSTTSLVYTEVIFLRFCEISRIESDPYILSNGALFGTLSTKVYKIGEKQQNDSPETFSYQLNVTSRHSAVTFIQYNVYYLDDVEHFIDILKRTRTV